VNRISEPVWNSLCQNQFGEHISCIFLICHIIETAGQLKRGCQEIDSPFLLNGKIFMESSKLPGMLSVKSKKGLDYMDMILKTTDLCKNFKGQIAVNNVPLNIRRFDRDALAL
jgi:hypothetical protein